MKTCRQGLHQYEDTKSECPGCHRNTYHREWARKNLGHAPRGSVEHVAKASAAMADKTLADGPRARHLASLRDHVQGDDHRIAKSEAFAKLPASTKTFIKDGYRRRTDARRVANAVIGFRRRTS